MARAGRKSPGRCRSRRRSGLRHQSGPRAATCGNRRKVAAKTGTFDAEQLIQKLAAADIAFARINDVAGLARHPHLRRITVATPSGPVSYPAPAEQHASASRHYGPVPALGEHTDKARAEFLPSPVTAQ